MPAEPGANRVADLAGFHGKGLVRKGLYHTVPGEGPEFTSLFGTGALGVFFRQLGKIRPAPGLLQDGLDLFLGRGHHHRWGVGRHPDEDVAGLDGLFRMELARVLIVVLIDIGIRNRHLLYISSGLNRHVTDLHLGLGCIFCRVCIVVSLEFLIRWIDFRILFRRKQYEIDLYPGVGERIPLFCLTIRDMNPLDQEGLELIQQQHLALGRLELIGRHP